MPYGRVARCLGQVVVVLGAGCASLPRRGLDVMVQGALEQVRGPLVDHHHRAGRPSPAIVAPLELIDPGGFDGPELRGAFFELFREVLSSPRYGGATAPEGRAYILDRLADAVGSEPDPGVAWGLLADRARARAVHAACQQAGRPVDYVLRAVLSREEDRYRLDVSVLDLADGWRTCGRGSHVR